MIKQGLDKAVELGLIKRRNRAGKASIFESCPENWTTVEKRPLREVTPPQRGAKDPAKQPSDSSDEKPIKEPETPIIESIPFRTALCPKCERVVEVEPVAESEVSTDSENPVRKPIERAREGPKQSKSDQFWEKLKASFRSGTS